MLTQVETPSLSENYGSYLSFYNVALRQTRVAVQRLVRDTKKQQEEIRRAQLRGGVDQPKLSAKEIAAAKREAVSTSAHVS